MVTNDVRWAVALATTIAGPVWFWWWRRSAAAGGALIGMAISVASSVSVTLCAATADLLATDDPEWPRGSFVFMALSGLVCAAAFRIAPAPRDPESLNELQVRSIVRRTRAEHQPRPPAARSRAADVIAHRRRKARARLHVGVCVLLVVGTTILGMVIAGQGNILYEGTRPWRRSMSIEELVATDGLWAAGVLSLFVAPLVFVIWQIRALPNGRWIGFALCATSALSVAIRLLVLASSPTWHVRSGAWLVPVGAAAMAIVFAIAPASHAVDAPNPFDVRRALRGRRAPFAPR